MVTEKKRKAAHREAIAAKQVAADRAADSKRKGNYDFTMGTTGPDETTTAKGNNNASTSVVNYVSSYIGMSKFPMQESLAALNAALEHIDKYHNRAADAGTMERTVERGCKVTSMNLAPIIVRDGQTEQQQSP